MSSNKEFELMVNQANTASVKEQNREKLHKLQIIA